MDNGIYIALSRQIGLFRDMETTANNIANVNTTGYTSNKVMFQSYLVNDARDKMAFANDVSTFRNLQPGSTRVTNGTLDVALGGPGYFTLETPLGPRYTRAGNFQLDGTGTLVSQEGYPVLDASGQRVTFTTEDSEITIGAAGNIAVNGEDRATLAVVDFDNPQMLERVGDRLFDAGEERAVAVDATQLRVMQGVLEGSNVQPVLEVTHMIDVSRAVASTAKYIEVMYDLQRKTNTSWTQQS